MNTERFIDNNNGTVTDNLTGLVWLQDAHCFSVKTWADALSSANNLSSGSYGLTDGSVTGDWRLPNRKELFNLVDCLRPDPALPEDHPFLYVQSDWYWSSTTYALNTNVAWFVHMGTGVVDVDDKSSRLYVWPVRDVKK